MARRKEDEGASKRRKPATSIESREQELASKAYDLAEEQIEGGTASSQVVTHFLKVGSRREQLEQQRMHHEIELMEVKKMALERESHVEELFTEAIKAMKSYTGSQMAEPDED
jgi:hypothetical protein